MSGDNQNENKFMAMLERKGIVRKVSDDTPATAHVGTVRLESDPPADTKAEDNTNVSPYEKELNTLLEQADASIAAAGEQLGQQDEAVVSEQTPAAPAEHYQSPPPPLETPVEPVAATTDYSPGYAAQSHPSDTLSQSTAYEPPPAYQQAPEETSSRDNLFSWMGNEETATEAASHTVEASTERYLDVEELYEVLSLRSKKTDTIYLIEDYLNSIPDSLPDESRRQIITKIVSASGFDYDLLMGDGILRVKMLKEYAEKFARHTDDYVEARMAEIAALESELQRIQDLIEDRRELHKKQFLSIEAEAGRLREILTFING